VTAAAAGEGRTEQALGGFVVPYSPEYLRFRSNPNVLKTIAERTGGRLLTGIETGEEVFLEERASKSSSRPISDIFLLVLVCLVPLDVAVRRIQLDWMVIKGWLGIGRAKAASGATFEALLKRKESIAFTRPEEEWERTVEAATPRTESQPEVAGRQAAKGEAPEAGAGTARRLLNLKKRWRNDEE
jgi:hypothetical protein